MQANCTNAPNTAYLNVVFPSLTEYDQYSFRIFLNLYEAFCAVKQWDQEETKISELKGYLVGTALQIYRLVNNYFRAPYDVGLINFGIITSHIEALLHIPSSTWQETLDRCCCQYCGKRPPNIFYGQSPCNDEPGFGEVQTRAPLYQNVYPRFSGYTPVSPLPPTPPLSENGDGMADCN